jgi:chromosome segregation ATPase
MDWTTIITATVTGILSGGIIVTLLHYTSDKRQKDVDADHTEEETKSVQVASLETTVNLLMGRIEQLQNHIDLSDKRHQQYQDETERELEKLNVKVRKLSDELNKERERNGHLEWGVRQANCEAVALVNQLLDAGQEPVVPVTPLPELLGAK